MGTFAAMVEIPGRLDLNTGALSGVFGDTTASYKHYWMLALPEAVAHEHLDRIPMWRMIVEMVVLAWYPVLYFRLSFGRNESLFEAVQRLQGTYHLSAGIQPSALRGWLLDREDDP